MFAFIIIKAKAMGIEPIVGISSVAALPSFRSRWLGVDESLRAQARHGRTLACPCEGQRKVSAGTQWGRVGLEKPLAKNPRTPDGFEPFLNFNSPCEYLFLYSFWSLFEAFFAYEFSAQKIGMSNGWNNFQCFRNGKAFRSACRRRWCASGMPYSGTCRPNGLACRMFTRALPGGLKGDTNITRVSWWRYWVKHGNEGLWKMMNVIGCVEFEFNTLILFVFFKPMKTKWYNMCLLSEILGISHYFWQGQRQRDKKWFYVWSCKNLLSSFSDLTLLFLRGASRF